MARRLPDMEPSFHQNRPGPILSTLRRTHLVGAAAAAFGLLGYAAVLYSWWGRPFFGGDFAILWSGAQAAWAGAGPEVFDPDRFQRWVRAELGPDFPFLLWPYPPTALLIALLVGWRPYVLAFVIWIGLTLALLLAACRHFFGGGRLAVAIAAAPSTSFNLWVGQNGFLTGALAVGAWSLIRRRPRLAGLLLGLLAFKPQLLLLTPVALIAMRAWSTILAAVLTAVGLGFASAAAFSLQAWTAFFSVTMPFQLEFVREGLGPFQWMSANLFMAGRLLGVPAQVAWAAQWLLAIPLGWIVYRTFRGPAPGELKVAVLFTATCLAAPQVMNYDMALLSVACLVLVSDRQSTAVLLVAAAGWVLPWAGFLLAAVGLPIAPLVTLALLVALLRKGRVFTART